MLRSLSVIVPAFNEELRLPRTLELISEYLQSKPWDFVEILVVDDGSTDRTAQVAREFAASQSLPVKVLQNPGNRGKGFSVRHGMEAAQGEWRLFTDADLSTPIEELAKLVCAVEQSSASVAIGSRALDRALIGVRQPHFREAAGKLFNTVMRLAIGLPLRDTQCGFKLFSKDASQTAFDRQRIERFGFDVEALFVANLHGFRITEVPVLWNHVEGTKVGIWNGAQSFLDLFFIRLNQFSGRYR